MVYRDRVADPQEIPLFPLRTVLFPGGRLPLRIFEPRYVDMIGRCMRDGSGFGVVLIRSGSESRGTPDADQPEVFDVGTLARIVDFDQLEGGLLGVVAVGESKFRIEQLWEQADHLLVARVTYLPDERALDSRAEDQALIDILRELIKHPMIAKLDLQVNFDDARSLGWRLSELLPIEAEIKQSLLQMHLPYERLAEVKRLVNKLRG